MNQDDQKSMKRPYQVAGVALILLALFMGRESLALHFYTSLGPGPGFFPFWVSVILAILAALMVYNATTSAAPAMPEDFIPARLGALRVVAIVAALVGLIPLMDLLGFRISTFVFLLFLLFALGRQNLLVTVLVALAGSVGTYYAFDTLLKSPLPIGMFGI